MAESRWQIPIFIYTGKNPEAQRAFDDFYHRFMQEYGRSEAESIFGGPFQSSNPFRPAEGSRLFDWFRPSRSREREPHTQREPLIRKEYERLSSRHKMLLSLLGSETIESRLSRFFPKELTNCRYHLSFHEEGPTTWGDYASFISGVDRLYKLLLTFIGKEYFIRRWLVGEMPVFKRQHLMTIESFKKSSPGEVMGPRAVCT